LESTAFRNGEEPHIWRDTRQICLSGHVMNNSMLKRPENNKEFCHLCGQKTISQCPKCKQSIDGDLYEPYEEHLAFSPPQSFCEKCGEKLPWAAKSNAESTMLIETSVVWLENLFSRFHRIVRKLRKRHNSRSTLDVQDEYDIQDLLNALLSLKFDDVRREEWTPSYAGGSSRIDFLLKNEQIVIEVKAARKNLTDKEIGEQLLVDIDRYRGHQDCKLLVCFVYDPEGWISNPDGLTGDLGKKTSNSIKVISYVFPKN
jgi:hypothetical protein